MDQICESRALLCNISVSKYFITCSNGYRNKINKITRCKTLTMRHFTLAK